MFGARRPVGPGSPSPAGMVRRRGSLSCPPSPPRRSRRWCCGPGLGPPRLRVCPQDVLSLGVRLRWAMDLLRMDGWRMGGWTARRPWRRGRGVGPAPGMARNGRRPRRRGTALVCGWRWDPALVFLVARLCPGVFWSPGGALAPVPRPLLRVLAGPSPPLPAFPPCPVRATACVCPLPLPFPAVWGRAGLASRGCRLPASVGRWRPRVAQCPRSPP